MWLYVENTNKQYQIRLYVISSEQVAGRLCNDGDEQSWYSFWMVSEYEYLIR